MTKRRRLSKVRDVRGFSLVEILVALAISAIVGMAAFTIFSTSNWSYMVQENVSDTQQNVRAAISWISKDIRLAGFGLPEPPFSLEFSGTAYTSAVNPVNSSSAPDQITLVGIGRYAGELQKNGNTDCNSGGDLLICMNSTAEFESGTGFVDNRRYISLDGIKYFELKDSSGQTQTDLDNNKLSLNSPAMLDRSYADGTSVYIIQAVTYSIQTDSDGPYLAISDLTGLRGSGNQRLADDIEDIQFAFIESTGGAFVDNPSDPSDVLAVRVNVVGRTRYPDAKGSFFSRECLEDRADDTGCTDADRDGYRRRVLTKVTKVRNLERI